MLILCFSPFLQVPASSHIFVTATHSQSNSQAYTARVTHVVRMSHTSHTARATVSVVHAAMVRIWQPSWCKSRQVSRNTPCPSTNQHVRNPTLTIYLLFKSALNYGLLNFLPEVSLVHTTFNYHLTILSDYTHG